MALINPHLHSTSPIDPKTPIRKMLALRTGLAGVASMKPNQGRVASFPYVNLMNLTCSKCRAQCLTFVIIVVCATILCLIFDGYLDISVRFDGDLEMLVKVLKFLPNLTDRFNWFDRWISHTICIPISSRLTNFRILDWLSWLEGWH